MKVVLLVSAERGRQCVQKITSLLGDQDDLIVFTFKETPWEPPYVEAIQAAASHAQAPCYVTAKVEREEYRQVWESSPDVILMIGWRYLVPKHIYESASVGCFVFHDSFLPEYRGFGPSVWALRNGENHTGATLFRISENMDEGPVLIQRKVDIAESDYISDVVKNVTAIYQTMLEEAFFKFRAGPLDYSEQDESKATYTCKNIPSDFHICWKNSAESIRNMIRAYASPYPGAYTYLNDEKITILEADIDRSKKYVGLIPGRVVRVDKEHGVFIGTGDYPLIIKKISAENANCTDPCSFIRSVSATLR